MQDHESVERVQAAWDATRGLDYASQVRGGSYMAWVRRWIPASWGETLGGPYSDSTRMGSTGRRRRRRWTT